MNSAHLLSLMVNAPLLAHPRKAVVVYNVLRARVSRSGALDLPDMDAGAIDQLAARLRPQPGASEFEGQQPAAAPGSWMRREPFRLSGGVGIISITGSLVNRGAWVGNDGSGLTSYEGIKFQIQRAAQDDRASSIILDIETPGGQAIGAMETAQAVREAASRKPVYAVVNGMAASAGYAIASGATRIITTPSGLAGSIGAVMLHLDHSEMLSNEGIKPTLIFAGQHKVDGNPLEPLSDAVKDELRAEVNSTYELFLDTVAAGRGRRLSKTRARETQARTFMGQTAVEAGLADAVGTFEEVLAEATSRARRASGGSNSRSAGMSRLGIDEQGATSGNDAAFALGNALLAVAGAPTPPALPSPGAAAAQTPPPAGVSPEAHAAAVARAATDAAAAVQARFAAILASPDVKGREAAALALATESPGMSAEQVVAFVKTHIGAAAPASPGLIAERAAASGVNGVSAGPVTDAPGSVAGGTGTEDERIAAGWEKARAEAKAQFDARSPRH